MAGDAEFAAKLASLVPARRARDTSAARQRIRTNFDGISSARDTGVTWQQIAELMTADGVLAADGTPPTANEIRALYHLEKYARGGKRKRRRGSAPASPSVTQRAAANALPPEAPMAAEDDSELIFAKPRTWNADRSG